MMAKGFESANFGLETYPDWTRNIPDWCWYKPRILRPLFRQQRPRISANLDFARYGP